MTEKDRIHASPIVIGSDHAAFDLKEKIKSHITEKGVEVLDMGTHSAAVCVDYPDVGMQVASLVSEGKFERAVLLCGTGIGMSMVANKFPRVRAALCNDLLSAIMSKKHNNANILVMGGRLIGETLAMEILEAWMATPFDGGRHLRRLEKFETLEKMTTGNLER